MRLKKLLFIAIAIIFGSVLSGTLGAQTGKGFTNFHSVHVGEVGVECTDCHKGSQGMELYYGVRPGHSNCDSCHEDAFSAGDYVALCGTCHTDDSLGLGKFGGELSIAKFSHTTHVDPLGRVDAKTGQRQDCVFCHRVEANMADAPLPNHGGCLGCHSGAENVSPAIENKVGQCVGCHSLEQLDAAVRDKKAHMSPAGMLPPWMMAKAEAAQEAAYSGAAAAGSGYSGSWADVVPFNHGSHVKEKTGDVINCMACHKSVSDRSAIGQAASLPDMDDCAVCHQSIARVGSENAIRNCEVCHTRISAESVPGRDGLMTGIAHTATFNLAHGDAAREEEGYCAYCHDLKRTTGNLCDECHASMQPGNHIAARFSETEHGHLAAMDRENCAVCHESDFCVRCHNIPPRSHAPLPLFGIGALHREYAALNLRSCFACHTFEATCSRCHERELRNP